MGARRRRIDKVLDATFLTNLSEWPLDELRSRHAECLEIETEVSYARRMRASTSSKPRSTAARRAGPSVTSSPPFRRSSPTTGPRAPVAKSSLTRRLAPSMDIEWKRARERLITDDTFAKLPNLDDDELQSTLRERGQLEQQVSQQDASCTKSSTAWRPT